MLTLAAPLAFGVLVATSGLAQTPASKQAAKATGPRPVGAVVAGKPVHATHGGATGGVDPFRYLKLKTPIEQLGPLRSVRKRRTAAELDPKKRRLVVIKIMTSPEGARVYRGRRRVGVTPLELRVPPNSTPWDLIIRAKGFMTIRTRIQRDVRRAYAFKLTPSKFR